MADATLLRAFKDAFKEDMFDCGNEITDTTEFKKLLRTYLHGWMSGLCASKTTKKEEFDLFVSTFKFMFETDWKPDPTFLQQ